MAVTPIGTEELVSLTIEARTGKLADNITENMSLLYYLKDKGNIDTFDGGSTIRQELEYDENEAFKWYSGYETLSTETNPLFTHADFDVKQAGLTVSVSGLEEILNTGKEAIIKLVGARMKNAEKTFLHRLSEGIYSDGTGYSGKQIGGLQHLVSDAGTGTVGGLNSSTETWWQNYVYDFSTNGLTASSATIWDAMHETWINLKRNREQCDLVIADDNFYTYYHQFLVAMQRITSAEKKAKGGFDALKFMGADVILDGGKGGDCPANHMYFLNTDYLHWRPAKGRDMKQIGGDRMSINQDAIIRVIAWAGNMTISNRSMQGVIVA